MFKVACIPSLGWQLLAYGIINQKESYMGNETQGKWGVLSLKYPHTALSHIWIAGRRFGYSSSKVRCAHLTRKWATLHPRQNPTAKRKKVMQIMLETPNTLNIQAMLLPYASGCTTSTAMDFGKRATHRVLIYQGGALPGLGCLGGNKLPHEDMDRAKYSFTNTVERSIVLTSRKRCHMPPETRSKD